jgi:hypothetical protein
MKRFISFTFQQTLRGNKIEEEEVGGICSMRGGGEKSVQVYVGFEVLTTVVMKSDIFWDITPCSPLKVTDVSEKHVASICSSEKLVDFQRTTRRYIPKHSTLYRFSRNV